MNDFTKLEIVYLYDLINDCLEEYNEPDIAYAVRNKLKLMHENYCSHKETYTDYDYNPERCKQCMRLINE